MPNFFTVPQSDVMEPEPLELIPPASWTIAYLSVPGVLALATRENSQRVIEVFTTLPSPSAPPTTQTLPSPPPIHFSAPTITPYNGRPETLRAFISQLINQLRDHDHAFPTEYSKVRFAYQCLGPGALSKMRSSFRCLEDPSIAPEIKTLSEFIAVLRRYCQDPGLRDKATRAVESMTQGNLTFHEFITSFEDNMADSMYAELGKDTWKTMLERRISYKLRDILLSSSDAPTEYFGFVTYLRKKDATYQEMRASFQNTRPARHAAGIRPANNNNLSSSNTRPLSFPLEPTVSQGGSAMDLDAISRQKGPDGRLTKPAKDARRALGRCLRCNEVGHIAVYCNLNNQNISLVSAASSMEESTNQLKDQL